jgi:hypothetical protein
MIQIKLTFVFIVSINNNCVLILSLSSLGRWLVGPEAVKASQILSKSLSGLSFKNSRNQVCLFILTIFYVYEQAIDLLKRDIY